VASLLSEVPERDAEGLVAGLYEDIREVLGLPLVPLVYRHLAVEPPRLETAWRELRPNLLDAAVEAGASGLVESASLDVPSLPPRSLRAAGVEETALEAVAGTLEAYNHANPRNLIALLALLHGAPGTGAPRASGRQPRAWDVLPMADLDGLDEPVRALLEEMAAAVASRGEESLVPSLYRHLAHHPGLLALAWVAVRPAVEGRAVARRANVVARKAGRLARALPHPVGRTRDPETAAVLRRFTETIPRMIVVGVTLRRALAEALGGRAASRQRLG
jgi:hypothetical protein